MAGILTNRLSALLLVRPFGVRFLARRGEVMSERKRPAVLLAIVATAWGLTGSPVLADDPTGGPGSLIWENSWDRRGISNIAEDFAMSPDGSRLFLTGWSAPEPVATITDYTTAAFDASTGDVLWGRSYAGLGGDDEAWALAVSPDGERVYVTGSSVGPDGSTDFATIAYDAATGDQLWLARYNGSATGDDTPEAISTSSDGARVYVTGTVGAEYGRGAMTTIAYDAATGSQLWVAAEHSDRATVAGSAITVAPDDSRVFVTGSLWRYQYDIGTVAYDGMTGEALWVAQWDNPEINVEDYGVAIAVTPDGSNVLVGGYTWDRFDELRGEGFVTLSYDALTGTERWFSVYRGTRDGDDFLRGLALAPDGATVYVIGPSGSNNNEEYHVTTVAYDTAAGTQLWASRDQAFSYNAGVAVRSDGSTVYGVDDLYDESGNQDIGTFAFDAATGAQVWQSRFDSGGLQEDIPSGVLVSPDGERVFVGGHSWYGPRSFDFAVLAYEA